MSQSEERTAYKQRWAKETYEWRKAHGICVKCGAQDARPGRVLCLNCSFRPHSPMTEEQRQRQAEKQKSREAERKRAGLCPRCGKPAYPGYQLCYECMLKAGRYRRDYLQRTGKRYRDAGRCIRCGAERLPERMVCAGCLAKMQQTAVRNFGPHWARNVQKVKRPEEFVNQV